MRNLLHYYFLEMIGLCGEIKGEINTEITSCYMNNLGMALGSYFEKYAVFGISTDASPCRDMLKNSLIGGLLSCGTKVYDFGIQVSEASRFAACIYKTDIFIHIETKNSVAKILLVKENGENLSDLEMNKLKSIMNQKKYMLCSIGRINNVYYVKEFEDFYVKSIFQNIKNTCFIYAGTDLHLIEILKKLNVGIITTKSVDLNEISKMSSDLGCVFSFIDTEKPIIIDEKGKRLSKRALNLIFADKTEKSFSCESFKLYAISKILKYITETKKTLSSLSLPTSENITESTGFFRKTDSLFTHLFKY